MFYLLLWRVVAWYWLALNWWAYITVSKRDYLFEIQLQTETWPRVKAAHNLAAVFKCQSVSLLLNEINANNDKVILISFLSLFFMKQLP